MIQIVEQTHEEKVKMYMKSSKKELIEMLISANLTLSLLNSCSVTAIHPVFNNYTTKEEKNQFIDTINKRYPNGYQLDKY